MYHLKEERSLGELFADLSWQTSNLFRQEVELAKVEMSQKASQARRAITFLAIGGFIAYAGFLAIIAAAIIGLAMVIPVWLSALIVGVVVAIIGYALIQKGLNDLKPEDLTPQQTIESIKETAQWAQNQI